MKKLFEQHQERMTPDEDRRVWSAMKDEMHRARPAPRRTWRLPALAGTAAVAVLAVAVIRLGVLDRGMEQQFADELGERSRVAQTETEAPASDGKADVPHAPDPVTDGTPEPAADEAHEEGGQAATTERRVAESRASDDGGPADADGARLRAGAPTGTESDKLNPDPASFPVSQMTPDLGATPDAKAAEGQASAGLQAGPPPGAERTVPVRQATGRAEESARTSGAPVPDKPSIADRLDTRVSRETPEDEVRAGRNGIRRLGPDDVGGTDPVNGQAYGAMFFRDYGTNPFLDPRDDRFATFAVDVDRASYAIARTYLQRNQLPPPEAIRVEEFVNAFDHGYPAPYGELSAGLETVPSEHGTFAIYLDAGPSPFGRDMSLLRVGLKGREIDPALRKPAVLTFVIDTSGSMRQGNRLELVKQSLRVLLDGLRPRDRVAIVQYGTTAGVLLEPTSVAERGRIEGVLGYLTPDGGTNAEAGLRAGYALASRFFAEGAINRVVLCSDGVANIGVTGAGGIGAMLERESRRGIELTAIGVGLGNYNDVLLEQLADAGDGNYYYVDTLDEAREVFGRNLTGTLQTIARDVKIQVEFAPGTVRKYRLLGYENRDVADRDFRNDAVDAGEVGAGHEVTALFEVHLEDDAPEARFATVRVRYADPATGEVSEEARSMVLDEVQDSLRRLDPTFRLDAAVAEFAEILRGSYWAREGSLSHALGVARSASYDMGQPAEARELVDLIETAGRLRTWPPAGYDPERDDRFPEDR